MGEHESEHPSIDAHGIRPPDAYAIEVARAAGRAWPLLLEGEFDLAASPALREQLEPAAAATRAAGARLVRVTFVDSSALRELLRAAHRFAADGGVRARGLRPPSSGCSS